MKKIIFILLLFLANPIVKGQIADRFTYMTTIGTGISMDTPSITPFAWQVAGHYKLSERFSAGIGTGLSVYEKALIPLFADARFQLTKPRRFVPYLQCGIGYAFAPGEDANGGFFFHPSVGVQYKTRGKTTLLLSIGYEIQNLERLKKYENSHYAAEFREKLHHNLISIKLGVML